MLTLYNVISSDGFIARKDGSEDFIPDSHWPRTLEVLKQYDRIVMGRKTYDAIQNYDKALKRPFEELPARKIVITGNRDFHPKHGYEVAHAPEDAIDSRSNIVVTSGPTLNDCLLQKGLVDRILFHEIPVALGDGIRPYAAREGIEAVKIPIARRL